MKIGSLSVAVLTFATFGAALASSLPAAHSTEPSVEAAGAPDASEGLGGVSGRRGLFESFGITLLDLQRISAGLFGSPPPPESDPDGNRSVDPDGPPPVLQMVGAADDCNGNGVDDAAEIAAGAVPDANGNGVPDECDQTGCPTRALRVTGAGGVIPDAGDGSLIRTLTVPSQPGNPMIQSIRVTLDLTHTWTSDLLITLRRGEGDPVTLQANCGSFHDLGGRYHFTDLAWQGASGLTLLCEGQLVNQGGSSDETMFRFAPGTFRPMTGTAETGFQSMRGQPLDGTWTLSITDSGGNEVGTLEGWSIQFRFAEPNPADCDANGVADACEIAGGGATDEDADGEPDRCERARGDLNLDGRVGPADLTILLGMWGQSNPPYGDFNGDGIIGPADLAFLLSAWSPPAPEIAGVTPASGPATGGTTITITGANLAGTTAVKVGGAAASSVTVVNATTVTAVTPPGLGGAKDVSVTTPGGTATASNAFTYIAPPAIWSVTPATGPAAGGTTISITGANLSGTTAVTVGGVAATSVTVVNPTKVTAVTPAGAAGARDVSLTTPDGTTTAASAFTFIAAPAISGVAPNAGPVAGGTPITITGVNLSGTTSVKVGGVAATGVTVVNATTVTAMTPAGVAGAQAVTLTTLGGTATAAGAFTYVSAPTISSVSPAAGPTAGGTPITITGTNLTGASSVTVGGVAATGVTVVSDTTVTATTPAGVAGAQAVALTTLGGSATTAGAFTYVSAPMISSVSPAAGPTAGGTPVTITGTNLTGASSVTVGGVAATGVTVVSDTTVTAVTPVGVAGAQAVTLTTLGGTATTAAAFTYVSAPVIASVSPASGSPAGGTLITITGTNLTGTTSVMVGGNAATAVTVVSDTTVTATTPAGVAGAQAVALSTVGGTASLPNAFTYSSPPSITAVTPGAGPLAGNTPITITGANLTGTTSVTVGGVAATAVTVVSDATVTATTPAGTAGAKTVSVTTPGGTANLANGFTYVATPTIASVSPNRGPLAGGTAITITGTNFYNGGTNATVTVGGVAATSVVVVNATTITATTPAGTSGAKTVSVTTPSGTANLSSGFTYVAAPTVTGVSPATGPVGGGTAITITGTNFYNGSVNASVSVGGVAATSVTVVSTTTITATTPAGAAGPATVAVETASGTASLANGFTYAIGPTIASVSPTQGPVGGNTAITITGSGFVTPATVQVGGIAATGTVVVSPTIILTLTPPGTAGEKTVSVTVPAGTASLPNAFTYVAPPSVTSVGPSQGPIAGGTTIIVVGSGFVAPTTLQVGPNAATGVTVLSPTTLTAVTPAGTSGPANVAVTTPFGTTTATNAFTYFAPPTIATVNPATGPVSGGTAITVTGTNLSGTTSLTVGGTAATSVNVVNATTVSAVTPAGTAGAQAVAIATPGGVATLANGFSYVPTSSPTIASVSPNSGPPAGGTQITITGTNFYGGASPPTVTVGGVGATSVTVVNPTTITATTPAGTLGPKTVSVTTPSGTANLANGFTFIAAPTVTAVSPAGGPTAGGTPITITGTNFYNGSVPATVTVGGVAATSVAVTSPTTITAVTPAGAAGAKTVSVTTASGTANLANGFTHWSPPTLSAVNPNKGPFGGGTVITITGTNFYNGATNASVTVGGVEATSVSVVNATTITATTPAGTAGAKTVTVTTPSGTEQLVNAFTYVAAPTVTSVSPSGGPLAGGTTITITGTNFYNGSSNASVTVGGVAATSVTVVSASTITAVTPAGTAGAKTVSVTTPSGTANLDGGFTYYAAPTVTGVSPSGSPPAGGISVTITGTNFYNGVSNATVTIGGVAATSISVVSPTSITATVPAGTAGSKTVAVTTPSGTGSLANGFTYFTAPTISSVSPPAGPIPGGTSITINGQNFYNGTINATVTVGGVAATSVAVVSPTQITAVVPAGTEGPQTVSVTTQSGTANLANGFRYFAPPTIAAVNPVAGPIAGGTTITITGTNFYNGTTVASVKVGDVAATAVSVVNPTTITAVTPAGAAGAKTVSVTTSSGLVSLENGFTHVAVPTIASVAPSAGPLGGGTEITIIGTNFYAASPGSSVKVGGVAATSVTVVSPTTLTAVTPAGSQGLKTVSVTTPGGTANLANGFNYLPAPQIYSVNPSAGPIPGGTEISISGVFFYDGSTNATVTVGGVPATSITVVNSNNITAIAPPGTEGPQTVTVTTPSGAVDRANGFRYFAPPVITSVSPPAGPVAGGTTITVNGSNFYDGTTAASVTVGGVAATVNWVETTVIQMVLPAGIEGPKTVSVTTPSGAASLRNAFVHVEPPTITAVSPAAGPNAGGTEITITGTNFYEASPGTTVRVGGVAATSVVVVNPTTIRAVTPSGATGPKTVSVTTPGGIAELANGFRHFPVPTISSVTPNVGPVGGGTQVTILGNHFYDGTTPVAVSVGGVPATAISVESPTSLTAVVPAGAGGPQTVSVSTPSGTANLANGFRHFGEPTIASVSPAGGPLAVGTPITITGTNFYNGSSNALVTVGGVAATSVTVVSATTITAVTPAGTAGAKTVSVTTPSGMASLDNGFTYYAAPTVTGVSPSGSPPGGGISVTITGTNFYNGVSNATVTIGGVAATSISVVSPTSITATVPAGTAGAKTVAVTTPSGTGSLANGFTYFSSPTVSAVSPAIGPVAGGTPITITGTNFYSGSTNASVTVGGVAATSVVVVGPTSITAVTPAGTPGPKTVSVTTPTGTANLANSFTYYAAPTVTSVSPGAGPVAGGTGITITGTSFYNGVSNATVTIGGVPATAVVVNSTTSMVAVVPAGTVGPSAVAVTTPSGTGVLTNGFDYVAAPTVTAVSPSGGPLAGNTPITITGTNFYNGSTNATVTVGGVAATSVVVVNATTVTAVTPAGTAGAKTVSVTTPSGMASLDNGFTYYAAPTVTGVAPSVGPVAGGTAITITGTNFYNGVPNATVTIGGVAATSVSVVSPTSITATVPAGTAGPKAVAVTTPSGTGSLANGFTYFAVPTIVQVNPAAGPIPGGTPITITGQGFFNGSVPASVTIGGVPATSVSVLSSTQITAVVPAGTEGPRTVSVTTQSGTANLANGFRYFATPTIASVSPAAGPIPGGTTITITGSGFYNGTTAATVSVGGVPATSVSVGNQGMITAVTPAGSVGPRDVTVNTPSGTATAVGAFAYALPPTIAGIAPNEGPAGGGTPITITGTNLGGATAVRVGGVLATGLSVVNDTTVTALTPAGTPGVRSVAVTTPGGTATASLGFNYVAGPTIASVTPNEGPVEGGTVLFITGANFWGATSVKIGTASAIFSVSSPTSITAVTPAGSAGIRDVSVTTLGGTAIATDAFVYRIPGSPTITAITPNVGLVSGGSTVTITGTDFWSPVSVSIGGVAATSVNVVNSTTVTAVTPAGAVGPKTVSVTTPNGTGELRNGFTHLAAVVPPWATLLEAAPDPAVVTNEAYRTAIMTTGYAWRVRHTQTQIEMLVVPMTVATPTNAFYLGRYEVTQAQWTAVMGSNPSGFQTPSGEVPADQVQLRPINGLNYPSIDGFNAATGLRLPTEAEWEYAYRAGTTTAYHSFSGYPNGTNDAALLGNIAWYDANSAAQTRPVGQKQANALGFHDMSGNVFEWVSNVYFCQPPLSTQCRVLRGGSWNFGDGFCRADTRFIVYPHIGYPLSDKGFRAARTP